MKNTLISFAMLGLLAAAGCDNNGVGEKGETCQVRADCRQGLACINNTCVLNEYNIADSAQSCNFVECNGAQDCIDTRPACAQYDEDCNGGDQFACDNLANFCDYACESSACVLNECDVDADCGAQFCVNNACVPCRNDGDCQNDDKCTEGFCIPPCEVDFDCGLFDTCSNGVCQDGSCENDRECVALTNNVESVCNSEGACTVPCTTDTDCGSFASNFNFFACVSGECTYVGCESDNECRAQFFGGGSVPDTVIDIQCVDDPVNPTPPSGGGGGCTGYTCIDGSCIPSNWVCDGFDDCSLGEDEFGC